MTSSEPPRLRSSATPDLPDMRLSALGPIAVIAPHPDDETLGCGGLMALCGQLGVPLTVVAMTDGEASHPGSRTTTPAQLIRWRAEERARALAALGVAQARVKRLRLPDGGMDNLNTAAKEQCVADLVALLRAECIQTVLVTASDDEHPDHQTSYALVRLALRHVPDARCLIYSVWPPRGAVAGGARWSLDIDTVRELKRRAIACFASQHGEIIEDDPAGFIMPEALLGRALADVEIFYPDHPTIGL